ncbi:MAG TPA: type I polyketide synthase, partial [Thermoanaerobaculia bacterium]
TSPFFVPQALVPWVAPPESPLIAGGSSFGQGGSNAHLVVSAAPTVEPSGPSRGWQLLMLSARSETALERATARLVDHLRLHSEEPFADVAYSLATGRKGFEHRTALVASGREDALEALASNDPRRLLGGFVHGGPERPVAFVFSGLGEQYPGMAAGLYRDEPVFREELDRVASLFASLLQVDLRPLLFPEGSAEASEAKGSGMDLRRMLGRSGEAALGPLDRTALLQPALFAVEYALAKLWMSWGVEPQAMIGYSLGEYVAACLAGVLSLEDATPLVAERARLIDSLPEGAMLAVPMAPEEAAEAIAPFRGELALSAVNGPALSVVAGPIAAIDELAQRLSDEGRATRRLRTTHAFHSPMMREAAAGLSALARQVTLRPPRIPYLSNVTGTWITAEQATDPGYWAEHLVRTVRFSEGVAELWREPGRVLLEIGPGESLAALALQHPCLEAAREEGADPVAVASLRSVYKRQPDQAYLLGTLAKLWLSGVKVDTAALYAHERRRRLPLPAYPFDRRRYWLEAPSSAQGGALPEAPLTATEWLYLPSWRRSMALPPVAPCELKDELGRVLVLADPGS